LEHAVSKTWTVDTLIDNWERRGIITKPFSLDERCLAERIASAMYFWVYQQELPGRCEDQSDAWTAMGLGINRVRQLRGDML
jgi:hypothetical protein